MQWCQGSKRLPFRASRRCLSMCRCMVAPGAVGIRDRRPARQGGCRKRASGCAAALSRLGAGHAAQAGHGQPRAGRPAQGGQPLRPADCAGPDGRDRRDSLRCAMSQYVVIGELSLDGTLMPVSGVLACSDRANGVRARGSSARLRAGRKRPGPMPKWTFSPRTA